MPNRYVPRSIQNIFDRVEAYNESITKELFSEELPKTFEVVIYDSKAHETKSKGGEAPADDSNSVANYYFYKARSLKGHHDMLPRPETASSIDEYERLRNQHYQAIIKKKADMELPQTGDVWLATSAGGNLVTLVSLQRKGNPRDFFIIGKSKAGSKAHKSGENPTGTVADYSATARAQSDREEYPTRSSLKNTPIPPVNAIQKKLLNFISKKEGSYNASNNGTDPENKIRNSIAGTSYVAENFVTPTKERSDQKLLSTMTLKEIMELQKGSNPYFNPNAGHKRTLFAVGAYQIIPKTMPSAIMSSGLSETDVFNEDNQDKLGLALIYGGKRPALRDYLRGSNSVTLEQAQTDFALEWASVPLPTGKSAYAGTGNAAGHTSEEVQAVLKEVRKLNIQNGFTI